MTARRVNPLSPAPPAGAYAQWLAAGAAGILAETAAVNLLAEHGAWLTQPAFTSRCIDIFDLIPAAAGTAAAVRWRAAITALPRLPASRSEKAVLKIAASIAAGTPVSLSDCLGSLDTATLRAVLRAIACANSGRAGEELICDGTCPPQDPPF